MNFRVTLWDIEAACMEEDDKMMGKELKLTGMSLTNGFRSEEESVVLRICGVHLESFWKRTNQLFVRVRVI